MFFFRLTALIFAFLVFAFSGCFRKGDRDAPVDPLVSSELSTKKADIKEVVPPGEQTLLYWAAVENGFQKEVSVDQLIVDYRERLYGNLFLEHYLSSRIEITMDEIREYYLINRFSYVRQSSQVRLIQFLTQSVASAIKIKQTLLQYDAELRTSLLREHGVFPVTFSPGDLPHSLDLLLFGSSAPRGVLGPVKTSFGYHVFEVQEFFPEGSFRGLDEVYDDISQTLYQSRRVIVSGRLLDSLGMAFSLSFNKKDGV